MVLAYYYFANKYEIVYFRKVTTACTNAFLLWADMVAFPEGGNMTIAYRLYITFLTVLVALFTWAVATSEPRQGYAFMHALICLFVVMTDLIVNNSVYQRHFYPIEQEAKRRLASLGLPVREVRVRNLITHWRPAVIAWLMNVAMLAYCVYFYFVNELPKRELMSRNTHLFILGINALGLLATYTLWWDLSRILKKSKR